MRGKWFNQRRKFSSSITGRIFLYFLVVIILPSVIIGFSSYFISVSILKDKVTEQYKQRVTSITQEIEDGLDTVKSISDIVFLNKAVKNALVYYSSDPNMAIENTKEFQELMSGFSNIGYNDMVEYIEIFGLDENVHIVYDNDNHLIGNPHNNRARHKDSFKEAMILDGKILWKSIGHTTEQRELKLYRVIKDHDFNKVIGFLHIAIDTERLAGFLHSTETDNVSEIIFLDMSNNIITFSGNYINALESKKVYESFIGKNDSITYGTWEGKLIESFYLPYNQWKVVSMISMDALIKDNKKILYVTALSAFVGFVLCSIIWLMLSYKILIPIKTVTEAMKRVKEGNIDITVNVEGRGEIKELCENFNFMIQRISELFVQTIEKNNLIKDKEYKALQAQINPHFLYNTLNSIRWMAIISKENSIKTCIEALSRLLRSTTCKNGTYITVETEISNLKDYIYIQKLAYGNKFDVIWEIDESLIQHRCIRFILQPILENAIFHGIVPKEGIGKIKISLAKEEKSIVFHIKDDGVGMDKETIHNTLTQNSEDKTRFTAIGISNVNERLCISYGENYGIEIESEVGLFTDVKINIPLDLKEE